MTGDASSFRAMLSQAKESVQATAKVVDSAVDRIQSMGASITQFSRSAVNAFGMLGLQGSVQGAFDAFAQLERQTIRLNAAIEVNGGNVEATTRQYKGFIDMVTTQTLATKPQIRTLLQEAEALGKTGDAAIRMTTIALGLSKGNIEMAKSQIHVANMIEQGNVQALRRILRMHGEKDETKLTIEVNKRMAAGLAILKADANTTWGQIQKLKRSLMELNTEVGSLIAEAIKPVVKWLQDAVAWFKGLDAETRKTTVAVIAVGLAVLAIGPALGVVRSLAGLFSPIGVAAALAASAVTIWVKSVGGLANAWEIVKETAAPILEFLVGKLTDARDVAVEFFLANQKVLGPLILLAGAVGAVVLAFKAFVLVATVAEFLATLLGVKALLSAAAWVAYLGAVVLWQVGVVAAFAAGIAASVAWQAAQLGAFLTVAAAAAAWQLTLMAGAGLVSLAMGTVTLATLAYKGAVWLVMAASAIFHNMALLTDAALGSMTIAELVCAAAAATLDVFLSPLVVILAALLAPLVIVVGVFLALAVAIGVVVVAVVAYKAAMLVAAAVTWAFTTAVAAATATIGGLIVAFVSVGAAAYAVWMVTSDLWELFSSLSVPTGPLKQITTIFREWGGILKMVVEAAVIDMNLAWKILQVAARLAFLQIKEMWFPLWDAMKTIAVLTIGIIRDSFNFHFNAAYKHLSDVAGATWDELAGLAMEAWDTITQYLHDKWNATIDYMKDRFTAFALFMLKVLTNPLETLAEAIGGQLQGIYKDSAKKAEDEFKKANANIKKTVEDGFDWAANDAAQEAAEKEFTRRQKELQDKIKTDVAAIKATAEGITFNFSTPEIEKTREELKKVEEELRKIQEARNKKSPEDNKAADWAAKVGDNFKHAYKEIHKVNQILFGTAEASQRIEEWRDMITLGKSDKDVKDFHATLAGGGDAAQKLEDANDKLAMIVEFSRQTAAALGKAPPLMPAGFGGGGGL